MAIAALLPCTWRRVKYRPTGLQKAAHYNGIEGVVLGVKPPVDGGGCVETRLILRLTNDDANELLLKRSNMELADATALQSHEPELARALERLQLCCSPDIPVSAQGLGGALRNLVQGILDVTFPLESRLVDDSFADMALFDEICGMLVGVENVCGALVDAGLESAEEDAEASSLVSADATEKKWVAEAAGRETCYSGGGVEDGTRCMVSWLGESMAECLHWRRGALAYMLIATLAANKKELDLEVLDEGLRELDRMVATRSVRMAEGLASADGEDSVRNMVATGILSDTHLLAVVYSGELCYWAHEALLRGTVRREPCRFGFQDRSSGGGSDREAAAQAKHLAGSSEQGGGARWGGDSGGGGAGMAIDEAAGYRQRGVGYLKRYLSAVEIMSEQGPGSVGYGWDMARAQELLKSLEEQ